MSAPMLTALVIVAMAFVYVALPVMVGAYVRFRGRHTVVCPKSGLDAEVRLDAWHAAATAIPGPPRRYVEEWRGSRLTTLPFSVEPRLRLFGSHLARSQAGTTSARGC